MGNRSNKEDNMAFTLHSWYMSLLTSVCMLLCWYSSPCVHAVPSITLENTVIERGSQLYLECSLNVTSPYTVNDLAWCFNEIKIPEKEYHIKDNKTLLLIIEEAKLSHSGNYSCKMMSDESNYAKTHVIVGSIPNPPESVQVVSTSSESIKWSWKKPADWTDDYHLFYRVQYSSVASSSSSSPWQQDVLQKYDETSYELSDGKPYMEYYFKVSCISGFAYPEISGDETEIWSEWSDVITARTDEAAPSGTIEIGIAPDEVVNGEQRAVKLTWKPLKPEETNGVILKYNIWIWKQNVTEFGMQHISRRYVQYLGFNMTKTTGEEYKFDTVDSATTAYTIEVTVPKSRLQIVIVVVFVVASVIGVIIAFLLLRRSYLKMKRRGIFKPVPQVSFPFKITLSNDSGSGNQGNKRQHRDICDEDEGLPNARLSSTESDGKEDGKEDGDVMRKHCKDKQTPPLAVVLPPKSPDDYSQLTNNDNIHLAKMPSWNNSKIKSQLPSQQGYCKISVGGVVMATAMQAPVSRVPRTVHILTRQNHIPTCVGESVNGVHGNKTLTSCQVTAKQAAVQIHNPCNVSKVSVNRNQASNSDEDLGYSQVSANRNQASNSDRDLGYSQVSANRNQASNSDEDLGYSQVSANRNQASNSDGDLGYSQVSTNRNQASNSDEDLGYSQVSANRNQASNSDEDLGYSQVSANRNQASNSDEDLGQSQVSANRNQATDSDENLGYSQVSTNRNQASYSDVPITTNDNAAICNQGDNGYCKVTLNGHPVIQDDSSSMWSDSSESTYPPDSIDGEEVIHQSPYRMSGYVEQQPTTQSINNTGVRQEAAGDQSTSQHIHGYVAHDTTGSQPMNRQQTSQPINIGYVAHDTTGSQPMNRQQTSQPINNGYVAHDTTGSRPMNRQQTSQPINNGYVAHDTTGSWPMNRQQTSQPINNGYVARDTTGSRPMNRQQTSQPINNGYVAHNGSSNKSLNK
uniref:Cell wall protein IFF6-like n=1 Tax=Saccoglossus kowalevskii TaxID=10224 RepID=A0ABM0MGT1_SACKO|nr:PREDICTED: cell wall protein IFF6-like [Saccoglossus kowalevskii]